jgi:hypothetical protein
MDMTVCYMSARATLVVNGTALEVNAASLVRACKLFAENLILLQTPYSVRSSSSVSIVEDFVSIVEGGKVVITPQNFSDLWLLSDEFGFEVLQKKFFELRCLSEHEVHERLQTHDEELVKHEQRLAALESRFQSLERLVEASVLHEPPT